MAEVYGHTLIWTHHYRLIVLFRTAAMHVKIAYKLIKKIELEHKCEIVLQTPELQLFQMFFSKRSKVNL